MRHPANDELLRNSITAAGVLAVILLGAAVLHLVGLTCGLRALTNDEVSKAVSDVIGLTPIRDI
jgi:hypothetical protein